MGVLHTGYRVPQFRPPHLTPLPPLLSPTGEERGRKTGVLHTVGRALQFRPPSRPPPAGGRRRGCGPRWGEERRGYPRWGEERRGYPRWGEEVRVNSCHQWGRLGCDVSLPSPAHCAGEGPGVRA
jgi:hypothetical protein